MPGYAREPVILYDTYTISDANNTFLSQASASTNYLTQISASNIYLAQSSASNTYLTQSSASTIYATKTSPVFGGTANFSNASVIFNSASVSGLSSGGTTINDNLLYNGAMQINQRGSSTSSITSNGYYTIDRWEVRTPAINIIGTWTQTVENDAPTGSGFRKSVKMLCSSADAAPNPSNATWFMQKLEGQDLQRIAKGTSSAQSLNLSFWVKSNATGTYIAELYDNDNSRAVSKSYTINSSNTWEFKTLSFPADTTGVLDNDNAYSLSVIMWLAAGSSYTSGTLQTTWASVNSGNRAVGQTNLAASLNNFWQMTGIKLELGTSATSFYFKSYQQDLRECQRYYWRPAFRGAYSNYGIARAQSTTVANALINLPTPMRAIPTLAEFSTVGLQLPGTSTTAATAVNISNPSENAAEVSVSVASGLTAGTWYFLTNNNNAAGYIAISAEL